MGKTDIGGGGEGERSSSVYYYIGTSTADLATEKGRGSNAINHSEYAVVYLKTNKEKHTLCARQVPGFHIIKARLIY